MVDELHVCQPPMEQRPTSAPQAWQCPGCASWWDIEPRLPPQVVPAYDFLTHQGIVPAMWVPRNGDH